MGRVVVDIASFDPSRDELRLIFVESEDWPTEPGARNERLRSIQTRVFDLADVAIDGRAARQWPEFAGKAVCIAVNCPFGAPRELTDLVGGLNAFFSRDPTWSAAIAASKHIAGLRIEWTDSPGTGLEPVGR